MSITREEIKHIAELSRLELSEKEVKEFGGQLDAILKYIGQLNEVDAKNIVPTAQVSGLRDIWRADDVHPWNETEVEAALDQGEREGGQVKVKRVL